MRPFLVGLVLVVQTGCGGGKASGPAAPLAYVITGDARPDTYGGNHYGCNVSGYLRPFGTGGGPGGTFSLTAMLGQVASDTVWLPADGPSIYYGAATVTFLTGNFAPLDLTWTASVAPTLGGSDL